MKLPGKIAVLLFFLCVVIVPGKSQDTITSKPAKVKKYTLTPIRATMYAAALPGLGQIYNRKYWKLPFVYGGFGALGYAVVFNSSYYKTYVNAYQDFTDLVPGTQSYLDLELLNSYYDPVDYDPVLHPDTYNKASQSNVTETLKSGVNYYRKYRDLSYIGIAAWYLITIIDANVDASLFDYDISDDLKTTVVPVAFTESGIYPGITVAIVKNF